MIVTYCLQILNMEGWGGGYKYLVKVVEKINFEKKEIDHVQVTK